MLWLMTMGRRLNGVYIAFMIVAFMMGVAGAVQAPTLSLFLSREVGAQPFWIGLFYTVNAVAGILVSLWLAKRSDNQGDRRKLILFCCLMAVGNALLFAFNRHYLTLITCGVLLASLANTAMPQLFALAREYADSSAREVVMFSSVMRAQLSLAWVTGPPLAFMLALNYGFTAMFTIAAGLFVISLVMIAFWLPSVPRVAQPAVAVTEVSGWGDKNVRMLFIASTLMWTCNTMYIIDMPLWISQELGLPDKLAGILMGTAAGLEIPAMILAGYFVKHLGKRRMMVTAVAAGVVFYLGLIFFHSQTALLVLQLFNAIFIGIVAGIGMLWFQDLMPGRAGSATTLFTNSISTGVILAGVIQGALAQSFSHGAVYVGIAVISVAALLLTSRVKDV
ncbi:UNVERIFIED_ORG: SET family sugar efflux transporter-like MFS transporter [Kosakonia oryzae]|uniref:MFS transporter, SET family, sugar efflux transporter n=1 Tax=Kosakonia radicincitans TaxID=283686 RepID=A0AAX2ESK7_9ENTR|nr:sugar efflux transporter [Kosakonia radicincitans]MDP9566323.1 SET family sugar efflux transporter-like MFS transporter [Kosakonia oryzae]SFE58704.1 MFS transporter, SET family, sugar efflux transporter [Kosakonia radicincitans]SFR14489.1 MFS transporter, SET family, sugar efflux transporter [Kosakonia radicincitans]SFU04485.1 MFS transporter, SET family, sugar efflux transporter [Kosakonia radicincitans]SFX99138.1 MFS transporter, SET family, sugar efflux transporter [Kosakonia radicincita